MNKYETLLDWEVEREVLRHLEGLTGKVSLASEHVMNLQHAWTLPYPFRCSRKLETKGSVSRVDIFIDSQQTYTVININPARAVCEAWLLYMDAKE